MIRARLDSNCRYCGRHIRKGMPIGKVTFLDAEEKQRTEYVHAGSGAADCVRHARTEWPELNDETKETK